MRSRRGAASARARNAALSASGAALLLLLLCSAMAAIAAPVVPDPPLAAADVTPVVDSDAPEGELHVFPRAQKAKGGAKGKGTIGNTKKKAPGNAISDPIEAYMSNAGGFVEPTKQDRLVETGPPMGIFDLFLKERRAEDAAVGKVRAMHKKALAALAKVEKDPELKAKFHWKKVPGSFPGQPAFAGLARAIGGPDATILARMILARTVFRIDSFERPPPASFMGTSKNCFPRESSPENILKITLSFWHEPSARTGADGHPLPAKQFISAGGVDFLVESKGKLATSTLAAIEQSIDDIEEELVFMAVHPDAKEPTWCSHHIPNKADQANRLLTSWNKNGDPILSDIQVSCPIPPARPGNAGLSSPKLQLLISRRRPFLSGMVEDIVQCFGPKDGERCQIGFTYCPPIVSRNVEFQSVKYDYGDFGLGIRPVREVPTRALSDPNGPSMQKLVEEGIDVSDSDFHITGTMSEFMKLATLSYPALPFHVDKLRKEIASAKDIQPSTKSFLLSELKVCAYFDVGIDRVEVYKSMFSAVFVFADITGITDKIGSALAGAWASVKTNYLHAGGDAAKPAEASLLKKAILAAETAAKTTVDTGKKALEDLDEDAQEAIEEEVGEGLDTHVWDKLFKDAKEQRITFKVTRNCNFDLMPLTDEGIAATIKRLSKAEGAAWAALLQGAGGKTANAAEMVEGWLHALAGWGASSTKLPVKMLSKAGDAVVSLGAAVTRGVTKATVMPFRNLVRAMKGFPPVMATFPSRRATLEEIIHNLLLETMDVIEEDPMAEIKPGTVRAMLKETMANGQVVDDDDIREKVMKEEEDEDE
ncbi:hypothetical protein DFJ74DRAFT_697861 [Hyaloraphidium curvatum]|nr:hypothetical protein DFJ74DRAFT_697861 [Hyaloraphidium curvatum]